jgi:hypothetical protein
MRLEESIVDVESTDIVDDDRCSMGQRRIDQVQVSRGTLGPTPKPPSSVDRQRAGGKRLTTFEAMVTS